jgi:hypothetical protein
VSDDVGVYKPVPDLSASDLVAETSGGDATISPPCAASEDPVQSASSSTNVSSGPNQGTKPTKEEPVPLGSGRLVDSDSDFESDPSYDANTGNALSPFIPRNFSGCNKKKNRNQKRSIDGIQPSLILSQDHLGNHAGRSITRSITRRQEAGRSFGGEVPN